MESNATDDGAAAFWFQRRQSQSNKTLKKRDEGKTSVTKTKIRPQRRRKTDDDIATSNVDNVEKRSNNSSKKSSNKGGKKTGAFARQTTTKDGIEVWTRENQNTSTKDSCDNPIKEIRATVTYEDVSPINFWRAVADLDEYAQFVPYVGKHKVLKTRGKLADGSATFYVYGVVTAPVVKNRDYTIRIETKNNRKKGFESRWTLDTENVGPKPKKGVVRLLANDGGWTIQPSKKNREGSLTANGVSVTYEILTDPGNRYQEFAETQHNTALISSGNMQYPIKLIAWRKMIFPPRNFTFSVNANAPNATVANTTENIVPASDFVFEEDPPPAEEDKHTPKRRTKIRGPYKSQSRNGCCCCC